MYALEIKNLKKAFSDTIAVDNVAFAVPENSIFGIIGRNGAGKTTTIRMLMNIYSPDSGEVLFRGAPVGQAFRNRVGYLPEERGLYKKMKVLETLLFFAELKGKQGPEIEKKALYYLERFQLLDRKNAKIEDLSKGNQQKIQFITTVLHDPDFLILDEPFSGLDPVNTNLLKEIILELRQQGKVILFSTHLMEFAEKLCDHIVLIDKGKAVLSGKLADIKASYARRNVTIQFQGDISFLRGEPIVEKIEDFGNAVGITLIKENLVQELLKLLVQRNVAIKKFDAHDISLHEIFLMLAGDEPGKEAAHA